jgi:hypothetical protein
LEPDKAKIKTEENAPTKDYTTAHFINQLKYTYQSSAMVSYVTGEYFAI